MSKFFPAMLILFLMPFAGQCAAAENVQVKLTTSTPEIFSGQQVSATIEVVNTGKTDLELPRPDRTGFSKLISIDNPKLNFSGGIGIISVTGENPTVTIKPGESVTSSFFLSGKTGSHEAFSFKAGLQMPSGIVWSNPVTINFKQDTELPVKIETTLKGDTIDIANVETPQPLTAHVRIINTSQSPQYIGIDNECGLHELQSLVSDSPAITIDSGVTSCMKNLAAPRDVNLQPGEVYEQDCRINYGGEDPKPQPIEFRIGIKSIGHVPAWGDRVTVNVAGGSEAWTKHLAYLKNMMKENATPPADGLNKRYHENGVVSDACEYKGGKLDGDCKHYDQTGKLTMSEVWHDGDLVSYITYKDDGSIHGDIKFMRLQNGKYVEQTTCTQEDSDAEVSNMMPHCQP